MKNRFLCVAFSFLALIYSYAGFSAQKAVFSSSDDLKIVEFHSPVKNFVLVSVDEAKISGVPERNLSRSQKKTENSNQFFGGVAFKNPAVFSSNLPLLSDISESTFRVLLLPKSIKNIIFLQTVI